MINANEFNVKIITLWILVFSILLIGCNSAEHSGATIGQDGKEHNSINNLPISILFTNANSTLQHILPQNITITIKDDKRQLRTNEHVLLSKSIRGALTIKKNQLKLQLPKKVIQKWFSFRTVTYSFTIQATAKGFKPIKQKITITSKDLLGKTVELPMEYLDTPLRKVEYIPIAVQFMSIDMETKQQPKGIKLNLRDSLGSLMTAGNQAIPNQKSIFLKGNKINFKLPVSIFEKQPNNIYTFSIYAETENFLPITQKVVIKDKNGTYQPVYMLPDIERGKIDKLPEGVAISGQKMDLRAAKTVKEIIINSAKSEILVGENDFEVNVVLPAGTELRDEFNKSIESNNAFAKLTTMDTRFEVPRNSFPNGYLVTDAKRKFKDGNSILASPENPKFFSIFSYFDLSISTNGNGDNEVKNLSTSAKLTASLKPLNEKETAFNVDDQVALWYLEESTGTWVREQVTNIKKGDKGLEAEFVINHLSYYAIGVLIDACQNQLQVNLNGIDNTFTATRAYRATYQNGTGTFLGLLNLPFDRSFKTLVPEVTDLQFELLESSHYSSSSLANSALYSSFECGELTPLSITVPSINPALSIPCETVEFKIVCSSANCYHPDNIPMTVILNDGPISNYAGSFDNGLTNFDGLMISRFNFIDFELAYNPNLSMLIQTKLVTPSSGVSPFEERGKSSEISSLFIDRFSQPTTAPCGFKSRFKIYLNNCQAFQNNNVIGNSADCQ